MVNKPTYSRCRRDIRGTGDRTIRRFAGTLDPIRRLRVVAAAMACQRSHNGADRILEAPVSWCTASVGSAVRPATTGDSDFPGRPLLLHGVATPGAGFTYTKPPGGHN